MSTSKTCILFGFSPDPKCLGLCEGLVDEKDLAVDEDNFRRSIRFTLGGIIAEGCDRILADAGCYALPYVEMNWRSYPFSTSKIPLPLKNYPYLQAILWRCFAKRTSFSFLIWILTRTSYPTLPVFLPVIPQSMFYPSVPQG